MAPQSLIFQGHASFKLQVRSQALRSGVIGESYGFASDAGSENVFEPLEVLSLQAEKK